MTLPPLSPSGVAGVLNPPPPSHPHPTPWPGRAGHHSRLFCNRFLRVQTVHSAEQRVEWAYAFDVHCNGFVPVVLLLYVLQFFFMPILTRSSIIATLLGNTLYFVALSYYQYITFLGYSGRRRGAHARTRMVDEIFPADRAW